MKLIIVRHGETASNKDHILMGHLPVGLNDTGVKQAKLLGKRLKDEKIDFIYSSDLERTKQTVLEIIKYHKNTPVVYDERLRERSLGVLEGKKLEDFLRARANSGLREHEFEPEKGESLVRVCQRVLDFIDYLIKNHNESDTILLCTHGGWKRCFLASYLRRELDDEEMIRYKFRNTSVSIFEVNKDKAIRQILLNSAEHLEE